MKIDTLVSTLNNILYCSKPNDASWGEAKLVIEFDSDLELCSASLNHLCQAWPEEQLKYTDEGYLEVPFWGRIFLGSNTDFNVFVAFNCNGGIDRILVDLIQNENLDKRFRGPEVAPKSTAGDD